MLVGLNPALASEWPRTVEFPGVAGTYTAARWKSDWPGCRYEDGVAEGRVSVHSRDGRNWLRVTCVPGQVGPARGGAGWRWPVGEEEGLELRYTLQFASDFEFVKGGKLPGISGGPESVTGGRPADGTNGFSARLMWRRDGRGEAYVYHMHQPGKYGESFRFPEDFRFPRNEPANVRMMVVMNTPGQRDGMLRVWIQSARQAERLVLERTDMEWRKSGDIKADSVQFEVFHGGDDQTWAPQSPSSVDFSGLEIRPASRS